MFHELVINIKINGILQPYHLYLFPRIGDRIIIDSIKEFSGFVIGLDIVMVYKQTTVFVIFIGL